jgi:hypothetical protein
MHLDVSKNRLLALPESFSALSHITQLSLTGVMKGWQCEMCSFKFVVQWLT